MKILFVVCFLFSLGIGYSQNEYLTEGLTIEKINKIPLIVTNEFGISNCSKIQLDAAVNSNVLDFFENIIPYDKIRSELQKKHFIQTTEFKILNDSIELIKTQLSNGIIFSKTRPVLSDYSLKSKAFYLKIEFDNGDENNERLRFISSNGLSIDFLPLICKSLDKSGKLEFFLNDELKATQIENDNFNNELGVYFIGNIKSSTKIKFSFGSIYDFDSIYDNDWSVFFPSFIRIIIFNRNTNLIYFDNVYLEGKFYSLLHKDNLDFKNHENAPLAEQKWLADEQAKQNSIKEAIDNQAKNAFEGSTGRQNNGSTSTGQGATYGQGNQGTSTGTPGANTYGPGGGEGITFNLSGRSAETLPKPSYPGQEEGIVVVQVTVDKSGVVTKAESGVKGSTSLDAGLLNAAKRAALSTRFNEDKNAPAFQTGTITYRFVLN